MLLFRYVKSRTDQQLKYRKHENDIRSCKPEDDSNRNPIIPCSLVAWSMFTDTYSFSRINQPLKINKNGISWKSDRDHKFGKDVYPKNLLAVQNLIPQSR